MTKDGYPTRRGSPRASPNLGEPLCKKLQSLGDPLSLKLHLDALKQFQINRINIIKLLLHVSMPIRIYCDDSEGNASMADVGDKCLGSQRFAGQDEVMADAVFESVRPIANGKSWW